MEFGFVTNCLGQTTIDAAVDVAARLGYSCLEVGPTVARDSAAYYRVQRDGPVRIHSLIYGRNFLTKAPDQRAEYHAELLRLLDLAREAGIHQITTATGVDPALSLDENIAAALDYWQPLLQEAADSKVRIALEFCPTSGNFALGPYAWQRLLAATAPWPNFGLNYDPSHLLWQFIEPYQPLLDFRAHIFSVHAKDTIIWRERLAQHGILTPYARTEKTLHGPDEARAVWWEYRLPGDGELDWPRFFDQLNQIDYDGAVLLELEDPRYAGSREAVLEGLRLGLERLRTASGRDQ